MQIDCHGHRKRIEKLEKKVEILMKERAQRIDKEYIEERLRILQSERIARGFSPSRLTLERGYD